MPELGLSARGRSFLQANDCALRRIATAGQKSESAGHSGVLARMERDRFEAEVLPAYEVRTPSRVLEYPPEHERIP